MSDDRKIVAVDQRDNGAFLKLECGHSKWVGGLQIDFRFGTPYSHRCNQSPCYKPQRYMGNDV